MHKNNKAQLTKQSETERERERDIVVQSETLGLFNRRRRSLIAGSARDADVGTYGLTGSSQLYHKLTQFMWVHAPTAHTHTLAECLAVWHLALLALHTRRRRHLDQSAMSCTTCLGAKICGLALPLAPVTTRNACSNSFPCHFAQFYMPP